MQNEVNIHVPDMVAIAVRNIVRNIANFSYQVSPLFLFAWWRRLRTSLIFTTRLHREEVTYQGPLGCAPRMET